MQKLKLVLDALYWTFGTLLFVVLVALFMAGVIWLIGAFLGTYLGLIAGATVKGVLLGIGGLPWMKRSLWPNQPSSSEKLLVGIGGPLLSRWTSQTL
jgi:hypothetical protein